MSRVGIAATLIGASAAGAVAAISLSGGRAGLAPAQPPTLTTAGVELSTLTESALTEGTLDYTRTTPLVNAIAGTYTWLPQPGRIIVPGRTLYRVDNLPIVLMRGRVPAWRSFQLGMTDGPDISQLQAGLIAEHFADGLLTSPTGEFTAATAAAVERWQTAHGLVPTGQIPLGQIVFMPRAVRVGAWVAATGEPAAPGQQPYAVTTDRRTVIVPVTSDMPAAHVGESVTIVLPSQGTTPGRITAIGPVPPAASPGGNGGNGGNGGDPGASTPALGVSTQLTVTPTNPSATGTGSDVPVQISLAVQVVRRALSVPVSALLALAGGGYGVEIVLPSGSHRLVAVTTGVFAGGRVQVSGAGLAPGVKVVVAQ